MYNNLNNRRRERDGLFTQGGVFRLLVCSCFSIMLGMHVYAYWWGPQETTDSISDMKYAVMQLTHGLSWVRRKHERLQAEVERVSAALPAVAAAAARAEQTVDLSPAGGKHSLANYDRQMCDYALESAGGRVLDTGSTVGHYISEGPVSGALRALTAWACHECQAARAIIQPGVLPGECWAFKGERGEAVIRLVGTVHITGLSVEHIPSHIDPTRFRFGGGNGITAAAHIFKFLKILSAPREFQLEGMKSRDDSTPYNFGTFEYNKDGGPIQYFDVIWPATQGYNLIRFKVLSNWGHPEYTCVYRVRVHGDLVSGQAPSSRPSIEYEGSIDNE